jgi:hypothetical protein
MVLCKYYIKIVYNIITNGIDIPARTEKDEPQLGQYPHGLHGSGRCAVPTIPCPCEIKCSKNALYELP